MLAAGAAGSEVEAAIDRQLRVIARASLDGYPPAGQLQTRFPNVSDLIEQMRARYSTEHAARLAVAHINALQLGWRLFGDFLRASAGLDDLTDEELAQSIAGAIAAMTKSGQKQ